MAGAIMTKKIFIICSLLARHIRKTIDAH